MILTSSHQSFVQALVKGETENTAATYSSGLHIGILDKDYEILRKQANTEQAQTILSGLMSNKTINVLVTGQLQCRPSGALQDWCDDYLRMAICCNRSLVSLESPAPGDAKAFQDNDVSVSASEQDFLAWIMREKYRSRAQAVWILKHGGSDKIFDLMGAELRTAGKIVIYDRFISRPSMDCILEALQYIYNNRGNVDCELTVYTQNPRPGHSNTLLAAEIEREIRAQFPNIGTVQAFGIAQTSSRLRLHDRFVQINENVTYLLPAGIGCFLEQNGSNRDTIIVQMSNLLNYEEFEFVIVNGTREETCRVRI